MSGKRQVLFICEHGSAKSVIAAAHLERLARERGDSVLARSRGTNPDSTYPSHVVAGLAAEGLVPLDDAPCQLMPSDFDAVTDVITFCNVMSPPGTPAKTYSWSDVPAVSDDYATARDEIVRRIEIMLTEM